MNKDSFSTLSQPMAFKSHMSHEFMGARWLQ
jgi:hypothetical protein